MKLKQTFLLPVMAIAAFASSCSKDSNVTPNSTKPVFGDQPAERPAYCGTIWQYDGTQAPTPIQGYKFPLIAGQNINAGWVIIGQANGQYHVTIDVTLGDWYVKEAHVNFWDIPAGETSPSSNYGNPSPGQFPLHWYGTAPYNEKEATISVPTSVYPYDPAQSPQQMNVAVHAVVIQKGANGKTKSTETGWAGPGTKFTAHGSWATYLWCLQFWPCI